MIDDNITLFWLENDFDREKKKELIDILAFIQIIHEKYLVFLSNEAYLVRFPEFINSLRNH